MEGNGVQRLCINWPLALYDVICCAGVCNAFILMVQMHWRTALRSDKVPLPLALSGTPTICVTIWAVLRLHFDDSGYVMPHKQRLIYHICCDTNAGAELQCL